jgi:hypothetical protein
LRSKQSEFKDRFSEVWTVLSKRLSSRWGLLRGELKKSGPRGDFSSQNLPFARLQLARNFADDQECWRKNPKEGKVCQPRVSPIPGQGEAPLHGMVSRSCPGYLIIANHTQTQKGAQMAIRPEQLAELVAIPVEAAQLILVPPPNMSEQQLHSRLQELVPLTKNQLTKDQRSWIWEIHKNCDQLIHQRLASFTAAQAMTLASFSVLTVARFNAATNIAQGRLCLLDIARGDRPEIWGIMTIGIGPVRYVAGWGSTDGMDAAFGWDGD